jgi:hypothetical protein
LQTLGTHPARYWRLACFITALATWYGLQVWAATLSTETFGRYEIVVQEGLPVAIGEILGTVRRQTGLPEYPLVLGTQTRALELSILGPGNRPIRLASTPFTGSGRTGRATTQFIVERSVRHDETLTLWVRPANAPGEVSIAVDLQKLEHMLEGPR